MVMTRHKIGFVLKGRYRSIEYLALATSRTPDHASPRSRRQCPRNLARIRELTDREVAVIINDSFGRLDRLGLMGMSIGFTGNCRCRDSANKRTFFGGHITPVCCAMDELSAAASMLMGQGNEGVPVVIVRVLRTPLTKHP